jgi:hypothetical protein
MPTTITATGLTLMDWARRVDPNGKIDKITEMLNKTNEVLDDMIVVEGNTTTGHKTTIRTGLPSVAWRQINKGVQPTKSTTRQIEFSCGLLEAHGQVDEELVNIALDKQALRLSENAPNIESISQTLATTIFYGNTAVNPERFTGLTPYYSHSTAVDASANVIKAGGASTDNTSIWLVVWGENTIHAFFPRGSKAGIEHNDLGLQLVEDGITTGSRFRAWVDQYKAKLGLVVRDWRYAVRICNIDLSDAATAGATTDTSANLCRLMIQAMNLVPNLRAGKAAFYCCKEVKTALDIQVFNKSNAYLTISSDIENGSPITKFMGIPVRRVDALSLTETLVS